MPSEITMPQLSDTMTEGTVVKWYKKEGDKVKSGEKVADVETDKAVMEMESFEAGTLAVIIAPEGTKVPVGGTIAVVAGAKEDVAQVKQSYSGSAAAARSEPARQVASAAVGAKSESKATAPVAASVTPTLAKSGNGNSGRTLASPLARRIAAESGIDLSQVEGTGPGGRITQRDVVNYKPESKSAPAGSDRAAQQKPTADVSMFAPKVASGTKTVIALNKMRQTIAQRLQQSTQQLPHFYETVDIDIEELVGLRERVNKQLEKSGVRLSVGDFIAKAVVTALGRHPMVNSHFNAEKAEITQFGDVHLGMAVALEGGLIVPVLRNADKMGLAEIRVRSADLVDRARQQKLKQDEMTGATFTVSNLGTHGIKQFTAIINPPEVAILAVGAAEKRPVVRDGQIVARTILSVTMSSDHRVIDGAAAADFLRTLRSLLEEPGMMLV